MLSKYLQGTRVYYYYLRGFVLKFFSFEFFQRCVLVCVCAFHPFICEVDIKTFIIYVIVLVSTHLHRFLQIIINQHMCNGCCPL